MPTSSTFPHYVFCSTVGKILSLGQAQPTCKPLFLDERWENRYSVIKGTSYPLLKNLHGEGNGVLKKEQKSVPKPKKSWGLLWAGFGHSLWADYSMHKMVLAGS